MVKKRIPIALFGDVTALKMQSIPRHLPPVFADDYQRACAFLLAYQKNPTTFNVYRSYIEQYAQWCWFVTERSFKEINRDDFEAYLQFYQKPPTHWIGKKTVAKFQWQAGQFIPNPNWRPFVAKLSKAAHAEGRPLRASTYAPSDEAFKLLFAVLHSFYKQLLQTGYAQTNVVDLIKQKNQYYRKQQGSAKVRRMSAMQWEVIMEVVEKMATENPKKHERTLFIISLLYGLYLRVSELAANASWTPQMNHFEKDYEDNWWFRTVGKGNKERTIAVSDAVLKTLRRWRNFLGTLTPLPTPTDNSPLVCGRSIDTPIRSTRQLRNIVQHAFDEAVTQLENESFIEQALELKAATVHWLRHTGISDDVKIRPREHVRDDAGHSSSLITDRYIDVDSRERHKSAKNKLINN